ncbi:MAG: hypothetical protein DWQ07_15370 [Chloroflexi bacterium]|nr:MAG: hypothetical protein DWQ07_15370 [Chloroflexota bacterium]
MDFPVVLAELLPYLVGVIGVPVINWLKAQLALSGKPAMWLTIAVSFVLAIGALFLVGDLSLASFTVEGIFAALGQVLATTTVVYKLFVD